MIDYSSMFAKCSKNCQFMNIFVSRAIHVLQTTTSNILKRKTTPGYFTKSMKNKLILIVFKKRQSMAYLTIPENDNFPRKTGKKKIGFITFNLAPLSCHLFMLYLMENLTPRMGWTC